MDQFISTNDLENTFAFLDDKYICRVDQEDHDRCRNKFKKAARKHNFTVNEENQFFLQLHCKCLGP